MEAIRLRIMRFAWIAISFAAIGCASADGSPPRPTTCDPNARVGIYMVHLEEISGDCGRFPDSLISFDPNGPPGENCKLLQPDRLSEGNCKLERAISCDAKATATAPAATVSTTAVTREAMADGSVLDGTMTISISQPGSSCVATYSISAKRQ